MGDEISNELEIEGNNEDIDKLESLLLRIYKNQDYSWVVEPPSFSDLEGIYSGDQYGFTGWRPEGIGKKNPNSLNFSFTTAEAPDVHFSYALSCMFPRLLFIPKYNQYYYNYQGYVLIKNGKVIEKHEYPFIMERGGDSDSDDIYDYMTNSGNFEDYYKEVFEDEREHHGDFWITLKGEREKIPIAQEGFGDNWWGWYESPEIISVEIPNGVKVIPLGAFQSCINLVNVIIPDCVKIIERVAFAGCSSLKSIKIPGSVKWIGPRAFKGCTNLSTIKIPSGVKWINEGTFDGCVRLESIQIPSSIEIIPSGSFRGSGLRTLNIPKSVEIGERAFSECSNLTSVIILGGRKKIDWRAFSDCASLNNIKIPVSIVEIGIQAFRGCVNLTSITLPAKLSKIGEGAFSVCTGLSSIEIPKGVRLIDAWTFKDCSGLSSVNLFEGLEEIGEGAFENCTCLKDIAIPGSVVKIDSSAFAGCANLVIHALKDSYALGYAQENKIDFIEK